MIHHNLDRKKVGSSLINLPEWIRIGKTAKAYCPWLRMLFRVVMAFLCWTMVLSRSVIVLSWSMIELSRSVSPFFSSTIWRACRLLGKLSDPSAGIVHNPWHSGQVTWPGGGLSAIFCKYKNSCFKKRLKNRPTLQARFHIYLSALEAESVRAGKDSWAL